MLRTAQFAALGLFCLFAVLTAFFQLRAGMKNGEAQRNTSSAAPNAGNHFSHMASRCAVIAAAALILCMVCGAMNR
jgi:ABC-type Fe3+ transport system permease subunit